MSHFRQAILAAGLLACVASAAQAGDLDEFRVKRQQVFEFAQKPVVTRQGDQVTIRFTAKGYCDATVAIEDNSGAAAGPRIVRHLASGVLGKNAPAPFRKGSLEQTLVWDGKDDQGAYIDDLDNIFVRVSLGLRPQFERTLFWSPKKRIAPGNRPLFAAAPEGVYVFEGGGVDHIRLFDHAGDYIRTVYPFPPNRTSPAARSGPNALQNALSGVLGLRWARFPQDGRSLPVWHGLMQATLFTSGSNTGHNTRHKYGCAASALALHGARLALVMYALNRVATDGTTGGMPLQGPKTWSPGRDRRGRPLSVCPRSAAFSPDGRWLYLTAYRGGGRYPWQHGVMRMEYLGNKEPELFLGRMGRGGAGTDNRHFRCPLSVDVDSKGRV